MIRTCPSCSQKNHVPPARLADSGRCGACKAEIAPIAEPIDVDPKEFDAIIGAVKVPVLVDFWAGWCAPCGAAAPEVKKLAHEMSGKAIVLKVDTDNYPMLANRYGVRGIPNFIIFENGRVKRQQAGVARASEMETWL